MIKITTAEVIEIMLGKTLTYRELRELFVEKYPEWDLPGVQLAPKFRSIVYSLMRSPFADIEQILGRENKYHLKRISPDFYLAGNVKRKSGRIAADCTATQRIRASMSPEEAECCRLAAIFNQLLIPVRAKFWAKPDDRRVDGHGETLTAQQKPVLLPSKRMAPDATCPNIGNSVRNKTRDECKAAFVATGSSVK